ncbi:DEAD/DEAH box helicase [Amorphus orientalis]|uniref:DEAD-box ATP-dependent RNA helicase RhpA n=1 Tax=Amorphus orientalis TaxID=649198 RepID=A0AAE3VLM0_9HYPH|nr:DEAD/DEAH box helicase [Amorphus orientalis]MDQ0314163.1 ATP-dependent RNA helicase RhlE [Amorphus orientalis]
MTQFTDLGLARPILTALSEERHDTPTPIQAQAIPPVLEGRDLLGIAQTGTGKTAAFALPILNHLDNARAAVRGKSCRVLVLSPTRELCGQIEERFRAYGKHMPLKTALIIGGVPIGRQKRAVEKGADVVVATPGRLLDLVEQRALSIAEVEVLVLDEADQMLDMGFIHAIRQIVAKLPKQRQNLFFSATMPKAIAELAGSILSDPVEVAVTPVAKTADRVDQEVMFVDTAKKTDALVHVLANRGVRQALVFTRTKHGADKVVKNLSRSGVPAEAIHGNKSQGQRERTLSSFRGGKINALVATDIAARGIDVASVSHVINYDLPHVAETYVHRIGRTARNGADGNAITLCAPDEANLLRGVERLIKQKVPVIAAPEGLEATGRFDDGEQAQPGRNKKRPPRRKGPRPNGQGNNGQQARSNDTAGGSGAGDTHFSKPKRPARARPGGSAAPASPNAERKEHGQGRSDRVRGRRNGGASGRKLSRAAG